MFAARLRQVWTSAAQRGRKLLGISRRGCLPNDIEALALALLSEPRESTDMVRADTIVQVYANHSKEQRHRFHLFLARNFHPDPIRLKQAAEAYLAAPTPATIADLTRASEPPRRELLQRMNVAPKATAFLLGMREAVLAEIGQEPELRSLEQDLGHLLGLWFNRGFLELRRIEWNSAATVLEKIIAYEAVHEIDGWDDLRRRLAADRRCFAFFHPSLPGEPLIFVEVALCRGLASKIGPLLSLDVPAGHSSRPNAAIFYSISNCQPGLRGISLGNFLIKQVVEELRAEMPSLKSFATLSPIPTFRKWLDAQFSAEAETVLLPEERAAIGNSPAIFQESDGVKLEQMDGAGKAILQRLLAAYLTARNDGKGPDDPVARFHLRNGARLERVNWSANLSHRGISESLGMMVNYVYELELIESNHERFIAEGCVAHSAEVGELLKRKSRSGHAMPVRREAQEAAQ